MIGVLETLLLGLAGFPTGLFCTVLGVEGLVGALRTSLLTAFGAIFDSGLKTMAFERGMEVDLGKIMPFDLGILAGSAFDLLTTLAGAEISSGGVGGGVGSCCTALVRNSDGDGVSLLAMVLLTESVLREGRRTLVDEGVGGHLTEAEVETPFLLDCCGVDAACRATLSDLAVTLVGIKMAAWTFFVETGVELGLLLLFCFLSLTALRAPTRAGSLGCLLASSKRFRASTFALVPVWKLLSDWTRKIC